MQQQRWARAALSRAISAALLIAAFVIGNISPSLAVGGQTGTIQGQVVDSNNAPVANANVTIASPTGTYRATTDASGNFSILGVVVDTYQLSVSKSGYEILTVSGVTITGDQTTGLGKLTLPRTLQQIGRIRSRSVTSAFQPTQTQDTFTVSGQRAVQALGKTFSSDQTDLVASVPGVQINKNGNLSVRGSLASEIGFQFDGVNYTSVDHGGIVNQTLNGLGALSVTPGAADATQGGSGAGVINLVAKRGSRPAFGTIDLEAQSGNFNHQLGLEYGWATPDNRLSNYTSFIGQRFYPVAEYQGIGLPLNQIGANQLAHGNYSINQDFINNFVIKLGKDQKSSLQFLTQIHWNQNNAGTDLNYGLLSFYPESVRGSALYDASGGAATAFASTIFPLEQGQLSATQKNPPISTNDHQQSLLKLEYDTTFNPTTFLALRAYKVNEHSTLYDPSGLAENLNDGRSPNEDGGTRGGLNFELTHQFGSHNTVTLGGQYELDRPIFALDDPAGSVLSLTGGGLVGRSDWQDFVTPKTIGAPLTFGKGSANPCPVAGGCYLYYYHNNVLGQTSYAGERMPSNLLNSPSNVEQFWNASIRDQITLSSKLRADIGMRVDAANYHLPPGIVTGNVEPDNDTNIPRVYQPRISATYQFGSNDSIRASYGRSTILLSIGNLFTPLNYDAYLKQYAGIPLPGSDGNTNFTPVPGPPLAGCGSGEFPLGQPPGTTIPYRACTSYADLIRWEEDYFAPDNGKGKPSIYDNWEGTYTHQFRNGFALKLTPFYKRGYQLAFNGVAAYTTDPVTGGLSPLSFRPFYTGRSSQTGAELYLSTPDKPVGLSGYVSATYVNSISVVPFGSSSEDTQPLVYGQSSATNALYRSGIVSPFTVNTGISYKTANGFRVNPVFRYDRGFPYGPGTQTSAIINGVGLFVPTSNNAASLPISDQAGGSSPAFIDPGNPGSVLKPNYYATRGTPEGTNPGGLLTKPRAYVDLALEYNPHASKNTFGVQVLNLFNNYYSEPVLNGRYQPIATGIGGPLSGQTTRNASASYNNYQYAAYNASLNPTGAYVLLPTAQGRTFRFYYQLSL